MGNSIAPVAELVKMANEEIKTLTFKEVQSKLHDSNVVIIDIRDVRELWRDGKIPNALHAPRGMLEFWIDPNTPYHKPVFAEHKEFIFYCASAWRSALATKAVQDMGLRNAAHLEGGFTAWRNKGGDIETVEKR